MSYEPKPGTAAFRLLAALEALPHGEEVMSSRLAELAGVDPICVVGSLTAARTSGVVFARKKGATERSPVFWSLVDHEKDARPAEAFSAGDGSQTPDGAAVEPDVEAGSDQAPVNEPAPRVKRATAASPAPAVKDELRIALWSDGTLQIQRKTVGGAADLALFSRAETQQIVAYLDQVLLEREGA